MNGSSWIIYDKDFNIQIDEDTEGILEEVYEKYGQYSAWKLRNMTHSETPWQSTELNETISKEKIKEFFKTTIL